MARQIYHFAVTVPAGTTKTNPATTPLDVPTMVVDEIRLRFPPGPSGLFGVTLAMAGQQIIPYNMGAWLVANDERIDYPLDGYPDSGDWSVIGYNLGLYPHTVELSFLLSLPQLPMPVVPQPIPDLLLSGF